MNNPLEMTAAYFEGKLSETQVAELEAWLREDPARSKAFARQAMLDSHLTELLHEQNFQDVATNLQDDSEFSTLLQALDAPEGTAGPIDFTEVIERTRQEPADDPASLSAHDLAAVGGYVLRKFFTNKKVITTGICSAAAAVLLLTLILFNPFASDAPDPIANDTGTSKPTVVPPAVNALAVATLTAQREARWSTDRYTTGEALFSGQRLTLTAGFAEITTNDGAIAILEAPATVELLDNNNALRLHSGKIVGICETESSKGFVVHTAHMAITDIGTRFGVDASSADATEVHVYEGEIVSAADTGTAAPTRLLAGQAAVATRDTDGIASIVYDPYRFSAITPNIFNVSGTGLGLAEGDIDPTYRVVRLDGKVPTQPVSLKVIDKYRQIQKNDPALGQWIGFHPDDWPEGFKPAHVYTVETELVIDERVDLNQSLFNMAGHFGSELEAMRINGRAVALPESTNTESVDRREFAENAQQFGLKHGPNTIQFDIRNLNIRSLVTMHLRWELKPSDKTKP